MTANTQNQRLMQSLHSNIMIHANDWALATRNIDWYHGCVMGAISAWFAVAINLGIESKLEIRMEYLALITPDYKKRRNSSESTAL